MVYLQVNALSEWIVGIYLHVFTNSEREISIPHEAAKCGTCSKIADFELIVSEWVQVNLDNSRVVKLLRRLNHGVMAVVCWMYTTAIKPR